MWNFSWLDIDSSLQTNDSKWLNSSCDSTRKIFRWLWLERLVTLTWKKWLGHITGPIPKQLSSFCALTSIHSSVPHDDPVQTSEKNRSQKVVNSGALHMCRGFRVRAEVLWHLGCFLFQFGELSLPKLLGGDGTAPATIDVTKFSNVCTWALVVIKRRPRRSCGTRIRSHLWNKDSTGR